ncbi:hypothetical protein BN59_01362 [Legionella massiliensis]|uniref:Glycosyltransferase RgtA/B/C/D-like domain-containing protein n=1 Tax=Legionella massiliensis TaxID=1034943 RepID=A0A078KZB7_9GAMM|nr:glycosyltransferase family 39 protein [Legionella massiliensis]CDZ77083.1 hypothetical protein BN59_01362 [Legionella massiliensis]CEE12821.1 hypothetical protein BN1094_01362 [Legionella massiliensis]
MFSPNYFKACLPFVRFACIGFLFVGALCLLRLFVCEPTLGWDEAEQAVIAQQFSAGYLAQPPLYYWLQYLVFQCLGISLFSIALLKFSLIFLCLYFYHQICRLHCQDKLLAWCATLSWALIPNISIDLLPHRTHAVLSLLAACLTWYWLIKPSRLSKSFWYAGFGIIIGIGCLAKSNYLLFLSILLLSALTIKEFRQRLLQRHLLLSLVFICLVSGGYWYWLIDNFATGMSSAFKLSLNNKDLKNGILQLLKAYLIYGIPVGLLALFFPFWRQKVEANSANSLLWRYHLLVLPLLLLIVITANLHDFKAHWALSLFFLSPLLIVSQITKTGYSVKRAKSYLVLCILVQLLILAAWANRSYRLANFPLQPLVESIRKEQQPEVTLVSPSHWLLGSLMINLPAEHGFLLHRALLHKPLPSGRLLIVWKGGEIPEWVDVLVPSSPERQIRKLVVNQVIMASYVYK